jgi:glycerol uptake facilitator-like aquaporin
MNGNEFIQYVIIPLVAATLGAIIGAVLTFRYQRKMEL